LIPSFKKIIELLDRRSKIQFCVLFILLVFKSILDGFGIGLIAPYITAVTDSSIIFNHKIFQNINVYININSQKDLLLWMSIVLILYYIIKNIFSLFVTYYQSKLIFTKRSYLSRNLFQLYMNAPYSFHLKRNSAELDRNIRFEIPRLYILLQNTMLLFSNILLMLTIIFILILANWQAVFAMVLFSMIVSTIFLLFSGRYSTMLGKELQNAQLHLGQALKEGFLSIIEAKLLKIESFFPDRYLKHYLVTSKANWRQTTISSSPQLLFEILAVGSLVGVIMFLSTKNTDFISVMPIIGLFSFSFIRLIPSVTAILKSIQEIKFCVPSLDVVHADFNKLTNLSIKSKENYRLSQKPLNFSKLSLQNVSLAFPGNKNKRVLDEVFIELNRGESIGITGPSGCGKTTLVNLIIGLLHADSGFIKINDEEMHTNLARWQSLIGYVPQSIAMIDAKIRENIAFGLEGNAIDDEKIWSVLKEANLTEFVKDLPHQLDTFIGENGIRISGGQRQRLGLARALYCNPEVLIFDEATSSLDVEAEERITEEIMKLSGKRTLIIVAHRISTIKDCDVIYYMKDGKIVNYGKYEELKELNKEFNQITVKEEH
jgi:ATP-binding cassette, subfamily B, bacterial PglK